MNKIQEAIDRIERRVSVSCHPDEALIYNIALSALKEAKDGQDSMAAIRKSLIEHASSKFNTYQYKLYRVFSMNEHDWWASKSVYPYQAEKEYMEFSEISGDEQESADALSMGELFALIFVDEDGSRRTFMDELRKQVDSGDHKDGFLLASTEY